MHLLNGNAQILTAHNDNKGLTNKDRYSTASIIRASIIRDPRLFAVFEPKFFHPKPKIGQENSWKMKWFLWILCLLFDTKCFLTMPWALFTHNNVEITPLGLYETVKCMNDGCTGTYLPPDGCLCYSRSSIIRGFWTYNFSSLKPRIIEALL